MRTYHLWLASTFLIAGCANGQPKPEEEKEDLGGVQQDLCFVPAAPPLGFSATVSRSLDVGGNVWTDGFGGVSGCSFYTASIDTDPHRAEDVRVYVRTKGECDDTDENEQQAYVWKRLGTGSGATWSRSFIPLTGAEQIRNGFNTGCVWSGEINVEDQEYTRLIVGVRGEEGDGSPAEGQIFVESATGGIAPSPEAQCAVTSSPPSVVDANGSLDGSSETLIASGFAQNGCDFFTLAVDSNPDRVSYVYFNAEVTGMLWDGMQSNFDYDSMQIVLWTQGLIAGIPVWSVQTSGFLGCQSIGSPGFGAYGMTDDYGWTKGGYNCGIPLPENNSYTKLVLGARAFRQNGTAAHVTLRAYEE